MIRPYTLVPALLLAGCQTYSRAAVDLAAHATAFSVRHTTAGQTDLFDLDDGISRDEGRALALMFNPDARLARRRAGVAAAFAEHAGLFDDPVLVADFARILETVPHQWVVTTAVEFTLPLFGRRDHEKRFADAEQLAARLAARLVEQEVLLAVDRAWVRWSAAELRTRAAEQMQQRIEGLEQIAKRLEAAGALSAPESRIFTLERLARADQLLAARTARAAALLHLKRTLGLHPDADLTFVAATEVEATAPPNNVVELFTKGPIGMRLTLDYEISEEQMALEIARQWPDLILGPGWHTEDGQPRVGLGMLLPLPLWNRNAQAIAVANAERDVRIEALHAGLEQCRHDAALATRLHDAAVERRERIEREIVPLADRQLEDSRTLAERGSLQPLLLLDSLDRAHQAHLDAIAAALEQALRAIDLNSLTWVRHSATPGGSR